MTHRLTHIFLTAFLLLIAPLMVSAQPENTEALAVQYFQNGEYDKASGLFEVLYNRTPEPRLYTYYFDCLMQLKDYKQAEKFVSKQVKRYPERIAFIVDLGYVFLQSGDENAAKKQFELALKNSFKDRQGAIDLSNAFLLRGQTDYAIKALINGKKNSGYELPLNMELAAVYLQSGNFSAALGEYLELLDKGSEYMVEVESALQDILLADPDNSRNELFKTELLARLKKNPDRTRYSELLLWYFIQQKEFDAAFIQARSLDKRLSEDGQRVYSLGQLSVSNQAWDAAFECFNYIIARSESNPYWFSARISLMDARYLKITQSYTSTTEEIKILEAEYIAILNELGRNAQTLVLMQNLAHIEAFYLSDITKASEILNEAITMVGAKPISVAACKIELADILLMSGDVWEATLLYSQVEKAFKNDPIGAEAKFRNAKLSFYIGEFEWAKAQLDVLKAATSKLIANDAMQLSLLISDNADADSSNTALAIYSRADLLVFMRKEDLALQTLDSIEMLSMYHPLFDEVLFKKASIYLQKKDFVKADSLLQKLYSFYPQDILADDALFKMAELQEQVFHNPTRAMELYKELMDQYPGSLFVVDARKNYRILRGDKLTP